MTTIITLVHILDYIYPTDTIHVSGKAVINNVPVSARPSGCSGQLYTDVFLLAQPAAETWQNPAVFDPQNDPATRRSEKDWSGGMPTPVDSAPLYQTVPAMMRESVIAKSASICARSIIKSAPLTAPTNAAGGAGCDRHPSGLLAPNLH